MKLPEGFVESIAAVGTPVLDGLVDVLENSVPSVAVRDNVGKRFRYPGGDGDVPWCAAGHYLDNRPSFTLDPAFHQGMYYVQDASSMFIAHVLRHLAGEGPLRYLDACAAPGGKTTAAIDALPHGSLVVANEYVPARAAVLRENVIKWGSPDVIVTRGDTAALVKAMPESFDIIAADVPCSGEGMMRKDADAVAQWSHRLVEECADRQREIVGNLWRALKPGGFMVYSTCTFNRHENEEIIGMLVEEYGAESVEIPVMDDWNIQPGIDTRCHCYRFLPGRVRGEGLFLAVVRKPGDPATRMQRLSKDKKARNEMPVVAKEWLNNGEMFDFKADGERVNAFPRRYLPELKALERKTDVIYHGVLVATVKGRDLIPTQSLAMSRMFNRGAFHAVDVSRDTALEYLRRHAVGLPDGTPRGFVLLTYNGEALGFVKNLGNRANNLYPQSWRILN